MLIKVAVLGLGAICISGPIIQTIRFRRFGQGNPWRIPIAPTLEGAGWALAAAALASLLLQGALLLVAPRLYAAIPALAAPDSLRLAGFAIGAFGAAFSFRAQLSMGASWRVGTDPKGKRELVTQGVFNRLRNPIYLGFILQILGGAILLPTAVSALEVVGCYCGFSMIVASEERFLIATYGEAYLDYMKRTGRFLPRLLPADAGGKLST